MINTITKWSKALWFKLVCLVACVCIFLLILFPREISYFVYLLVSPTWCYLETAQHFHSNKATYLAAAEALKSNPKTSLATYKKALGNKTYADLPDTDQPPADGDETMTIWIAPVRWDYVLIHYHGPVTDLKQDLEMSGNSLLDDMGNDWYLVRLYK